MQKTAIVLVPEISLTPQMLDRFISRFGKEKIAVLHSKLSIGEKYDEWNKIKEGKAKIVIGARSAIFAPVTNLGIIIIDEEVSKEVCCRERKARSQFQKELCRYKNVNVEFDILAKYVEKIFKHAIITLRYQINKL